MINLKLGQYNKDGKFEKFLELGKDFVFGGDYILITEKMTMLGVCGLGDTFSFRKDKKDHLNRFNGLFNGRTYGNGHFVLIESAKAKDAKNKKIFQDDIISTKYYENQSDLLSITKWGVCSDGEYVDQVYCWTRGNYSLTDRGGWHGESKNEINVIGNLHENPELFSKIK